MNFNIPDAAIVAAVIGLLAFWGKADRKNIYTSISNLADEVGKLVDEMKEERRERAKERLDDLHRLSNLEAAFARLLGEHEAAMSAGGHHHRRSSDKKEG